MYFIGVDLAWGERRPTGLAVLDREGRLVDLCAQVSDGEIEAALRPYVTDRCVVAIDAPLVVVNAAGNRPCEAQLNRDFARFDAGAHPSNTGKRELAGTPRGARLAHSLGLDLDPFTSSPRRAIEVYPHPATVALFRLGRTLKYKHRTGRPLPQLKAELVRLVRLLEGLEGGAVPLRLTGHEGWRALALRVQAAERKSELRRAEDQVDAVLCAYVAMFAHLRPELTTVYGDLRTGYIVTPTLPEGHRPTPRSAAPDLAVEPAPAPPEQEEAVRRAVREYAEAHPVLRQATDRYVELVTTLLDDAGINYLSVTGRTKSVASFAAKAVRSSAGKPLFPDPLRDITDQLGVRVITYLPGDVDKVADVLAEQLVVLDDRDLGQETASEGRFGYSSRHLMIQLDGPRSGTPAYEPVGERRAQVQVRTVLQHAWAEFEHAIRYKGTIPEEHAPDLDRRFTLAAGLLELADREFTLIHERLQVTPTRPRPEPDASDPRISAPDLATFLAAQYPEAGWSRTDHYAWVSGLLLELGITSLDELGALLATVDSAGINARMGYRHPPSAVRRLDDALLCVYGARYLGLHGNAHREALLRARLEKLSAQA